MKTNPPTKARPTMSVAPPPQVRRLIVLAVAASLWLAPSCRAVAATLYDDLGGRTGIDHIADGIVDLYRSDPRLKDDFDNINPAWLKARLATYLCVIADGPCAYKGRDMTAAHKGLKIDQARFNAVAEDLEIVMTHDGVSNWTQNRLMARLAPLARQIVTR